MATVNTAFGPWTICRAVFSKSRPQSPSCRYLSTSMSVVPQNSTFPPPRSRRSDEPDFPKRFKTYPPPPSTRNRFPTPIASFTADQLTILDPTGARSRLFSRHNNEAAQVGDILLVRFKTGEPFSGVCLSIRRRGVDTGILLRNTIMRTGTEMWVKIFSPNVAGIEVVKTAERRARRARLYYMRLPKHDRGSVEGVVNEYMKTRMLIRSGAVGMQDKDAKGSGGGGGGKGGKGGRGKGR